MKSGNPGELRAHSVAAAFRYALQGVSAAWREQQNFRIHAVMGACVAGLGVAARLDATRWALLVFAIALVLAAELANTALEALVDLVSPDEHPLAGRAKDVAAAGVLIAAAAAVVIGLLVFVPVALRSGAPGGGVL